jgi:hypothetical protein
MPVDGASIEAQVGAAAGLWTHTPVDWRGNEGVAQPGSWPANAFGGQFSTATGTTPGTPGAPATAASPLVTVNAPTGITGTAAVINWTVNPAASTQVEYGLTTAYGSTGGVQSGAGAKTTPLSGLTVSTLYHYRIKATIGGVTNYSQDYTFNTLAA